VPRASTAHGAGKVDTECRSPPFVGDAASCGEGPDLTMRSSPADTVKAYIALINAGDAKGLAALGAPKLRFVDASGGRHTLDQEGWAAYFSDFPDYRIEVEQLIADGETVAVFGSASGSYQGRGSTQPLAVWRFPSAWRAIVRKGKVAEWRVYADIEPMLQSAGLGRTR
jgi:predicted ester cyclase